jgi:hypothetical protein
MSEKSENTILSITSYGPVSVVMVRVTTGDRSRVVVQFQRASGPDENPTHFGLEDLPTIAMICKTISEQLITVREPKE